jgi:large subunit ribosomal protein L17
MRNLSTALFDKEKITTTLAKAKELRPYAEKLISLSKRETLHARRLVLRQIHDKKVVAKMFESLSARYAERPGGYTRIIKLGPRRGDHAEMAIIELVGSESDSASKGKTKGKTKGKAKTKARKSKKPAAASTGAKADAEESKPAKPKKKTAKRKSTKAEADPEKKASKPKARKKAAAKSKAAKKD